MLNKYNCSQASLYAVARLVWQAVQDNQAQFFAFDATYTTAYLNENKEFIKTVERLPDYYARKEAVAVLSIEYNKQAEVVIVLAKYLKDYIERCFDKDVRDIMLNSAGYDYFAKVKQGNANAINSFLSSAVVFVTDKADVLTTKGKMPTDFLSRLQTADNDFEDVLSRYNAAVAAAKNKTDEKINANNEVFNRLQRVLADGRTIFLETPELAKIFQFSSFLARVEPTKNAGINGKITNGYVKKGLAQVTVTEPTSGKTYISDKDGYYEIAPLSMGTYSLIFSADGYITQTLTGLDVQKGVVKRLNVDMVPMTRAQPA